jgi:signal transduction histidine kinase
MKERTEGVGGNFGITSVPGKGCRLIIDIPVDGEDKDE